MRAPFRRGFFCAVVPRSKASGLALSSKRWASQARFLPHGLELPFSYFGICTDVRGANRPYYPLVPLVGHPHVVATPLSLRAPIAHCCPYPLRAHRVFAYHGVQDPASGRFFECSPFALGILLEVWLRLAGLLGKSIADPYTLQHEIRLRDSRHTNCCA